MSRTHRSDDRVGQDWDDGNKFKKLKFWDKADPLEMVGPVRRFPSRAFYTLCYGSEEAWTQTVFVRI